MDVREEDQVIVVIKLSRTKVLEVYRSVNYMRTLNVKDFMKQVYNLVNCLRCLNRQRKDNVGVFYAGS